MSASSAAKPWPLHFIDLEALSGLALLGAAALAFAWANSPWHSAYQSLWHLKLGFAAVPGWPAQELHFWVNDGLMSVFFLVVGLEIRREIHDGALADVRVATLPVIAALGGVIVPAVLYLAVSQEPAAQRGWAIPAATDIAFAVGVLSLAGRSVPASLRLLLLSLAIIDDIVAIMVIAFFYSNGIAVAGLAIAAAGVLGVLLLQHLGVRRALAYLLPGAVVWFGMLRGGIHPTLAGVLLGLLTPASAAFGAARRGTPGSAAGESPLLALESRLHPWVAFGVMPLFALANAGVSLQGLDFSAAAPLSAGLGIVAGLVLGKPLGIGLAAAAAVRLRLCTLPPGVRWPHIGLLGVLGGIGFTMSIFIANLAFEDLPLLVAAKFAVLLASTLAGCLGLILGRLISSATP